MRFIYKVLIGLIIFNGVIIAFSSFFPDASESEHAIDVTGDSSISGYGTIDQGLFGSMVADCIAVGGAVFGLNLLAGILTHQVGLFMGIGAFIAVLSALWSATNGVITSLIDYPIVNSLVTIIIIVIGVIAVFSVVEMLNAQRGAD